MQINLRNYIRPVLRELPCALLFSFFVCAGRRYRADGTIFTGAPYAFLGLWLLFALLLAAGITCVRLFRRGDGTAPGGRMDSAERLVVPWSRDEHIVSASARNDARSGSAECPAQIERSGIIGRRGRRLERATRHALLILAAWLPYLILRYPAAIDWDAYHQTAQGLGLEAMTAHWPPFVAFLLGRFAQLGITVLGSVDAGIFLFALAQTLLAVFVLTKSLRLIGTLAGQRAQRFFLLLYMFSPIYAGFLTTVVKDALFSILVLWLFVEFAPLLMGQTESFEAAAPGGRMDSAEPLVRHDGESFEAAAPRDVMHSGERLFRHGAETTGSAECLAKPERDGIMQHAGRRLITLTLLPALVCITRNNGVFIVFVLWAGVAWRWLRAARAGRTQTAAGSMQKDASHADGMQHAADRRRYRALTLALLGVMALYVLYVRLWIPSLGIRPGSVKEALSIPFQQSARYMRDFPEEITEDEAALVDTVLDVRQIGELYNPLLSDRVKDTYRESARFLPGYFRAWLSMGLRHPAVYIDATLHNMYGFFDPFSKSRDFPDGVGRGALNTNPDLQFTYPAALEKPTDALQAFASFLEGVPPFALACNVPLALWASFYLICECFRKKRARILALPSLISLLILVASPTWYAGGIRYALPVVLMLPVLWAGVRARVTD